MATLVYGVIVSGIAGSYVPHGLRQHVDVNQSVAAATNDVLKWSGTEWTPAATSTLPAGTHTHTGTYVEPATLASYAPLSGANFTDSITISGTTPAIIASETGGAADTKIYIDYNAWFIRTGGRDVFSWESRYSSYNYLSLGNQYREFTTSGLVGNPACVVYVDATAGNIALTLNVAGDYYRSNGTNYSGAWLIFVRKDATANTVTITPSGAETIDGAASLTMAGLQSMVFMQAVVGGWKVISRKDAALDTSDSGWIDVTLNTPTISAPASRPNAPSATWDSLRYRKIGKVVYLQGSFTGSITTALIGTLPEGYRPSVDTLAPMMMYSTTNTTAEMTIAILANGNLYASPAGGSSTYTNYHVNTHFMVD